MSISKIHNEIMHYILINDLFLISCRVNRNFFDFHLSQFCDLMTIKNDLLFYR